MFITVAYKDAPELSLIRRLSSDTDQSVEKSLLVNPYCPVRVMLDYIRKKCRLGVYTQFDLCDVSGELKGLFSLPTYAYATDMFEHKKTYYIIVIRQENDKRLSVLPQLNRENHIYPELKDRVKKFMMTGELDAQFTPLETPQKITPPPASKAGLKKK